MRRRPPLDAFKAILILALSRVIGVGRELLISVAFGFSRITDLFYQITFPLQGILTFSNGPFTTAFSAQVAKQPVGDRAAAIGKYSWLALRIGVAGGLLSSVVAVNLAWHECSTWTCGRIASLAFAAGSLTVMTGFCFAALIALGRIADAAHSLFAGNLLFVAGLLLAWAAHVRLSIELLVGLFALGSLISVLAAQARLKADNVQLWNCRRQQLPALGLVRSLSLAGAETTGFICTQLLVVFLAAQSGEGWTSGVALAQRICTSVNGLVISPIASAMMLSVVAVSGGEARQQVMKQIAIAACALCLLALVIATFSAPVLNEAVGRHLLGATAHDVLIELIPAFAAWLIPLGLNIILCRLMFGLGMERSYVTITLTTYALANLARYAAWTSFDLKWAVLMGAGVEVVGISILLIRVHKTLSKEYRCA